MTQLTIPPLKDRCRAEMTRDVVFLFQRRRWIDRGLPDGYDHDGEGVFKIDVDENGALSIADDGKYLTNAQLAEMETDDGGPCIVECWDTEYVFLSREEAELYGEQRSYNYPDGWRVYGVPSEGMMANLLKGT